MHFIVDMEEYRDFERRSARLFRQNESLLQWSQPVGRKRILPLESDLIMQRTFLEKLQTMVAATHCSHWYLAVVEPDPEDYFFHHFGKYPVLRISASDEPDAILSALHEDPGGSPADAMAYNSRILWIFPADESWAIYVDRDRELASLALDERLTELWAQDRRSQLLSHT